VQAAILAAISEPAAAAPREDGTGPAGTGLSGVYLALYGTSTPARAQRQSVEHAIARLGPGQVQSRSVRAYLGERRPAGTRTRTRPPNYWAPCTADDACQPCRYGNRAEKLAKQAQERFERHYPGQLEAALEHGVHTWQDYRPGARETVTTGVRTSYSDPQTWIARPSTEAEQAAAQAAREQRMGRLMRALR
jgi:hypothetical protein